MIKHHPDTPLLAKFVHGSLLPAEALIVSAHCNMCPRCSEVVKRETSRIATEIFETQPYFGDCLESYSAMLASITQLPPDNPPAESECSEIDPAIISNPSLTKTIELDGHHFELPPTLQRIAVKTGNWSGLVGRLWQAPVDLGYEGAANFIYMGRGGSVPEHTHRGLEYTLVLEGEFEDGINLYQTGDFVVMNGENTHAPRSDHRDGCLVFTLLDEPLHFTSGIARLLNPFSYLFFR